MTNNSLSPKDIYSFFKDHIKIYILSFVLSVVLIGGLFFYSSRSQNKLETNNQTNEPLFSFILENSQGNIMTASGAVKQVFLTSLQENGQFSDDVLEKLNVTYNDIQNTIDVQFVEEVPEQKQKQISELLQQEMNNGELPFFKNKTFYYINKEIENNRASTLQITEGVSTKKIILLVLVVIVITVGLGTLIVSWKEYKTKVITQKFTLGNDVQAIDIESLDLSSKQEKQSIINALLNGTSQNKFLVLENENIIEKENLIISEKTKVYSSLENIVEPVSFEPEEILIVCFKKNTTKKWYKEQVEIAKALTNSIKTIYI
ncbi:hypothetical protein A5844_002293 [Enterococcus sp. 10A9_DIV0425]|uniref:Uncharacterized protein n=1 Tax=Candidatus Enterococcus wittei TaxID=1987383 RepID=A0A242JW21_9ENTE|nr:hypothetical protein [Enterococcus sp. 10A9_DIV0425]OTP09515.1 hypothetical protein A5844_002293 [Enterococcus sp. 10A9_DIV0425]THE15711.1 hypothetical protein E1H99_02720 [Enterococcus hirae]